MASDYLNHADAYSYKAFRYHQKHRCGLLTTFRRSFSLSVRVSVAGKSFPQLRCRGSYHDDSCCLPDHVISGTTATHSLCVDCPDQSEPVPVYEDYAAIPPSLIRSGQYLLSSGVALTSRQLFGRTDQPLRQRIPPAFMGPDVGYVCHPTLIRCVRIEMPLEPVGRHDAGLTLRARGFRYPT